MVSLVSVDETFEDEVDADIATVSYTADAKTHSAANAANNSDVCNVLVAFVIRLSPIGRPDDDDDDDGTVENKWFNVSNDAVTADTKKRRRGPRSPGM